MRPTRRYIDLVISGHMTGSATITPSLTAEQVAAVRAFDTYAIDDSGTMLTFTGMMVDDPETPHDWLMEIIEALPAEISWHGQFVIHAGDQQYVFTLEGRAIDVEVLDVVDAVS